MKSFRLQALLFFCLTLQGCKYHSRNGLKRAETVAVHVETIRKKERAKDIATGELLRISQEALNTDVQGLAVESLLKAYPALQSPVDRKLATPEVVAFHEEKLNQSKDITAEIVKIQEQVTGIKADFQKALEKELKLSTIQTIIASIGGTLGLLLLFNLLMGGITNKFKK